MFLLMQMYKPLKRYSCKIIVYKNDTTFYTAFYAALNNKKKDFVISCATLKFIVVNLICNSIERLLF